MTAPIRLRGVRGTAWIVAEVRLCSECRRIVRGARKWVEA